MASIRTILTNGAAGIQTTQWAVALSSAAQPAQHFRMVEPMTWAHCLLSARLRQLLSGHSQRLCLEHHQRSELRLRPRRRRQQRQSEGVSGHLQRLRRKTAPAAISTAPWAQCDRPELGLYRNLIPRRTQPRAALPWLSRARATPPASPFTSSTPIACSFSITPRNDANRPATCARSSKPLLRSEHQRPFVLTCEGRIQLGGSTPSGLLLSCLRGAGDGAGIWPSTKATRTTRASTRLANPSAVPSSSHL